MYKALTDTPLVLPFLEEGIKAGFPSPAQDYERQGIDLNKALIKNAPTTFLAKVDGDSLCDAFVFDGDIAIVDKSLEPRDGCMVVACIDGEFAMKTVKKENGDIFLIPKNPEYPIIKVNPDEPFSIWGVVTYTIHKQY